MGGLGRGRGGPDAAKEALADVAGATASVVEKLHSGDGVFQTGSGVRKEDTVIKEGKEIDDVVHLTVEVLDEPCGGNIGEKTRHRAALGDSTGVGTRDDERGGSPVDKDVFLHGGLESEDLVSGMIHTSLGG